MTYDPDYKERQFKPLKQEINNQTESIYKSKKFILSLVMHSIDRLKPSMQKYYRDMQEFCEGYEAGIIRDWRKFFKNGYKQRSKP